MSEDLEKAFALACKHATKYRNTSADAHLMPQTSYYEMLRILKGPVPEESMSASDVISELASFADQGMMGMSAPRFFGWVLGGSHPAGVAADWMTSAWGQNSAYHTPTPTNSALESVAAGWLLDILDLPRESSVGFTTGATVANAVCLSAARGKLLRELDWDAEADGLFGAPPITVFVSDDVHVSILSALQLIGLGYKRVLKISTDEQGRINTADLAKQVVDHSGPKIIIVQAGQINTGAFDDFDQITSIAKDCGAWVHVDGAFGLWARASDKYAPLTSGVDKADSWSTDGHKWLQVPFDSGFAIIRNQEAHHRAMNVWASYLPDVAEGDRIPSMLVPELSRRGRGVAVWAMLKALGRQGISRMVEQHCAIAATMADELSKEPGITILNDVVLNQVVLEFGEGISEEREKLTRVVIKGVQDEGTCFLEGATWHGRWVMRISVINYATTQEHGERSTRSVIENWRKVQSEK
ncbi:MAG: aspartate aminotransferase family protein [Rhodospirillales bacterium]|jgi:glutamate/tyrosine decarboxylase-like PLP-dependent enzyme|nr:aspartate aminotransferase family protein [Rhodospirillales bacterium]